MFLQLQLFCSYHRHSCSCLTDSGQQVWRSKKACWDFYPMTFLNDRLYFCGKKALKDSEVALFSHAVPRNTAFCYDENIPEQQGDINPTFRSDLDLCQSWHCTFQNTKEMKQLYISWLDYQKFHSIFFSFFQPKCLLLAI